MASPATFISYRREDSVGHAGRFLDHLVGRVGRDRVFRDIDNIRAGEDFGEAVGRKINSCDVVLVLIGPRWLTAVHHEGRSRRKWAIVLAGDPPTESVHSLAFVIGRQNLPG